MTGVAPYSIPKEPGGPRSVLFALVVHLALLAFLWIGVSWQGQTPGGVEAEVWDVKYREAAPKEADEPGPVMEQEQPEQQREMPVNKTTPPPVTKAVEKTPLAKPAVNKPDIALEQDKKRKAEAKKAEEKKKADDDKRKKEADKKAAEDKRKQDRAEAVAKKKQEQAERKAMADARAADLRRMSGLTGKFGGKGRGGTGGQGTAARSTGDNRFASTYARTIEAKIKSNTTYAVPAGLSGNPEVVYLIELLPDGSLRRPPVRKKSSGLPGFDEAVFRAIQKSAPFPRDKDGKVPREITSKHRPKDL